MEDTAKGRHFEFFDSEKIGVTAKNDMSGSASECTPECERFLDDFAESDKNKAGVWYNGDTKNLADVAATLRKFAVEKGYHISVSVAETADGKEAILLSRLNESAFKETQKGKL